MIIGCRKIASMKDEKDERRCITCSYDMSEKLDKCIDFRIAHERVCIFDIDHVFEAACEICNRTIVVHHDPCDYWVAVCTECGEKHFEATNIKIKDLGAHVVGILKEYRIYCGICDAPITINDKPFNYWTAVCPECGELPVSDDDPTQIKDVKENIVGKLR